MPPRYSGRKPTTTKTLDEQIQDAEAAAIAARANLKHYQEEIDRLKALKSNSWQQLGPPGGHIAISSMSDTHLIRSINVCLRKDPRYDWTPERMASFANMVREAVVRGVWV